MKRIFLFLCLLWAAGPLYAQDYVDVVKIGYTNTQISNEAIDRSSRMKGFDVSLLTPMQIAPSSHVLIGGDLSIKSLALINNENSTFYNTIIKFGVAKTFNDEWNGYIIALPKFASDYQRNFGSSFLMGGIAMLKNVKSETLTWKFGLYGSQEAYGFFGTPVIGLFYRSPNNKLTIDASLPLVADVNYAFNNQKKTSIGLDFFAIRRSFFIGPDSPTQLYVENNEISFTPYFQYAAADSKLLLRLKGGYSTADFGLFATSDSKMAGISAANIGDNRTRLNQDFRGGLQVKLEATLRIGARR
ncbi:MULTISPECIES: hypothetical protein [Sphingobacterium]|uniref:Uncharacterized protein n=1 Tax=Sphingobacterium populi TaxID=1812824 RepID=A0ABW5UF44_9SPHI|nr:hypothetical protein [Sphingobacterium sp. CFCC 11742]